jgi:hypothetical protein
LYKLIKPKRKKLALSASEDDGNQDDDESINTFSTYDTVGEEVSLMGKKKKRGCLAFLSEALKKFQNVPFVFFCKHDDVHLINKAILYIQRNEQTNKIIIVHCANGTDTVMLAEHVKLMDLLYPKTKISLLIVDSTFTPAVIEWTSQALKVPINAMFISCPDKNFAMKVNQLRGMRIITGYD